MPTNEGAPRCFKLLALRMSRRDDFVVSDVANLLKLSAIPVGVVFAAFLIYVVAACSLGVCISLVRGELRLREGGQLLVVGPLFALSYICLVAVLAWPPIFFLLLLLLVVRQIRLRPSTAFVLLGVLSLLLSRLELLWVTDSWWVALHLNVGVSLLSIGIFDEAFRYFTRENRWKRCPRSEGIELARLMGNVELRIAGPANAVQRLTDLIDAHEAALLKAQGSSAFGRWRYRIERWWSHTAFNSAIGLDHRRRCDGATLIVRGDSKPVFRLLLRVEAFARVKPAISDDEYWVYLATAP